MKITRFQDIPQLTRGGNYRINVGWEYLKRHLVDWCGRASGPAPLDLNPDFQREHVWTTAQQIAYVEYILRGGLSGRDLYFNCVGWMSDFRGPFVIVDGKQRLAAALAFLDDEIEIFGSRYSQFTDNMRLMVGFVFNVNDLKTRAEVLQWYLEMNTGGTPHTAEEIKKVRKMLKATAAS